jgi:tetratricopeptide (TPR) repeat protein
MALEMRLSLTTPLYRLTIASALLIATAFYMAASACQYLADFYAERPSFTHLTRATFLQPWNADYQFRLARFFSLSASLPAALPHFRAATSLDPYQSRYWLDLAATHAALGQTSEQASALDEAIAFDPTTPDVAWEAANLYLVQGQSAKALQELRIVLANETSRASDALPFVLRLQPDVTILIRDILPHNADVYFALIDLLLSQGKDAAAAQVWDQIASLREPVQRRQVFEYVRVLLSRQQVDQALFVWRQAASLCDLEAYQPSPANLVINGDFSLDILNAGFDWRYEKVPGVALSLDPSQPHFGTHSLLIRFDGANLGEAGIEQLVAVEPNTTYNFHAFFRAKDMQGAGGVDLALADSFDGHIYFSTPPLRDADFWKPAAGQFTTGHETRLLKIYVERSPANNPIRGNLWLDAISLTPASQPRALNRTTP